LLTLLENSYLNWLWALPKQLRQLFSVDIVSKPKFHMSLTSLGMGKTRFICDWAVEALQRNSLLQDFVYGDTKKRKLDESFEWNFPSLPIENDSENIVKSKMLFLYELRDAVECDRHFGLALPIDFAGSEASPIIIRDIISTAVYDALLVYGRGRNYSLVILTLRKKYNRRRNKALHTFRHCNWIPCSMVTS
jgi:hypothetical protein